MPTLNLQQGTPEIPGYKPGDFEIPHPESPKGQEAREGEVRPPREISDHEAKPVAESREAVRQKIAEQAQTLKPNVTGTPIEKNPALNQLLTKVANGETAYEDLVLKTGEDAEQAMEFVNNLGK